MTFPVKQANRLGHKGLSLLPVVPVVHALLLLRVVRVSFIFAKRRIRQVLSTSLLLEMSIIHDTRFTSNLWWGKPAPPATWRLSSSSSVFCNLLFFTGRLIWFCFRVGAETLRSKNTNGSIGARSTFTIQKATRSNWFATTKV